MPDTSGSAGPVFVGGTGRSGTTIVGELVGARGDVAVVPFELRFHVDPGGLLSLARGEVGVEAFARKLRQRWWERPATATGPRGLGVLIDVPQRRAAMDRLRRDHAADPWAACAAFMQEVLQPFTEQAGARTWAEMTPPNVKAADGLLRLYPRARLVHMIRDGRDVASSVARRSWGPDDVESALRWWADQLIDIAGATARAETDGHGDRILTMRLEALVGPSREENYQRLVDFLGRGEDDLMRAFFERELSEERSHAERWRHGLDAAQQESLLRCHDAELARLAEAGVTLPPVA